MKLYSSKKNENDPDCVLLVNNVLIFTTPKPVIVQPSEIMKVPLNTVIKVPLGGALNITTHPQLASRVGEIFPGVITITSESEEKLLEIPVRNSGRNPLHIMPGESIAIGYLIELSHIEPEEFTIDVTSSEVVKSTPPKKNKDIKFELR